MPPKLLRLPGARMPADLATGDAILDDYLRRLDAALVGAASVRKRVTLEARDHLLEVKARWIDRGESPPRAARRATDGFGDPAAHGQAQRRERFGIFARTAMLTGSLFAVLMLIFDVLLGHLETQGSQLVAAKFVFHALFFGTWMGWFAAYGIASGTASRAGNVGRLSDDDRFTVSLSRRMAAMSAVLGLFMLGAMVLAIAGLLDHWLLSGLPWPGLLFIALIGLYNLATIGNNFAHFQVDPHALTIHTPFATRWIPWRCIRDLRRPSALERLLLPHVRSYWLCYSDQAGTLREVVLPLDPSMHHADVLLARLHRAAATGESHHQAASGH